MSTTLPGHLLTVHPNAKKTEFPGSDPLRMGHSINRIHMGHLVLLHVF